jgi:WD40 repeat protein
MWNVSLTDHLLLRSEQRCNEIVWSNDGTKVAVAATLLEIWNVADWQVLASGTSSLVKDLDWSPDGVYVAYVVQSLSKYRIEELDISTEEVTKYIQKEN